VRVPTPQGEAVGVVPPGTAAGSVFRLRGQGIPRLAGDAPGDLFVTIRIDVPAGIDARTDELVRELERLMPATPRQDLGRYRGGAT
jgi:molecular chaperone DnaJ